MDDLKLYVFRVGHGLCTLVQGKENGKSYNAVFDCGCMNNFLGEKFNGIALYDNPEKSLNMMVELIQKNGNHLDLLVSSHQDEDHNSLILPLITKLNEWEDITKFSWIESDKNQYIKLLGLGAITLTTVLKGKEYKYSYCSSDRNIDGILLEKGKNKYSLEITDFKLDSVEADEFPGQIIHGGLIFFSIIITFKTTMSISSSPFLYLNSSLNIGLYDFDSDPSKEHAFNLPFSEKMSFSELKKTIKKSLEKSDILSDIEKVFQRGPDVSKSVQTELVKKVIAEIEKMYPGTDYIISQAEIKDLASEKHIPTPKFYIKQVIIGGDSDNKNYNGLEDFFKKYKKYFYVESPEMDIRRELSYQYYDFSFDKGLGREEKISVDIEKIKELVELYCLTSRYLDPSCDKIRFNETSTVVNFIYNTLGGRRSILFPGDVTPHHQKEIGDGIEYYGVKCGVVFIPHHGSFNTNILFKKDEKNKKIVEDEKQPFCYMYDKISQGLGNNNIVSIIGECLTNDEYKLPRKECIDKIIEFSQDERVPGMHLNCYSLNDDGKTYSRQDYSDNEKLTIYTTGYSEDSKDMGLVFDLNADVIIPQPYPPKNKPLPTRPRTRPRVMPPDNLFI